MNRKMKNIENKNINKKNNQVKSGDSKGGINNGNYNQINNEETKQVVTEQSKIKDDNPVQVSEVKVKKSVKQRPTTVNLKDKSEQFNQILEFALEFEKQKKDNKKLRDANKEIKKQNKELGESLKEKESICEERLNEINSLKSDISHRDQVINTVKADKTESSQEYKNALTASLKPFYEDFNELKELEMDNDIGLAMKDTIEAVFDVLNKNGIDIEKK